MRQPLISYILCSTPRTGSTLLCSLLQSTHCAGVPESYFRSQDIESKVDQWNIRQPNGSFSIRDFLDCVLERGTSRNGVFAVRVMWGTMDELIDSLRSMGLEGTDREVLGCAFGPTRFVFIWRRETLAQAISRLRAEQTNVWQVFNRTDRNSLSEDSTYDRARIQHFIDEANHHNQAWDIWFTQNSIDPLRIAYEELDSDQESVTRKVLDFIEVDSPRTRIEAPNVRMADSISIEWAERFKTETQ